MRKKFVSIPIYTYAASLKQSYSGEGEAEAEVVYPKDTSNQIVIGIDPDADKHGVAVYRNGKLVELRQLSLMGILFDLAFDSKEDRDNAVFSIEDVCANNFLYARNKNKSNKVNMDIARKVGRNQQAQIELMRLLERYELKYVLHAPQKSNWAHDKKLFERATGWSGRSNKDTRSAAYFGYLEVIK